MLIISLSAISKSPKIDQYQQPKTDSISAKQSLDFQIITEPPRYRLISLRSNIIYKPLIIEKSYKNLSQNLGNQFQYYHDHMQSFDLQPTNKSD